MARVESPRSSSNVGRDQASYRALADFATRQNVPVVQYRPRYLCLADDHPMHCGYDPNPFLKDADLVIVADSDVPWLPEQIDLIPGCKVVHIGLDPLFARYPIRGFQADSGLDVDGIPGPKTLAALRRAIPFGAGGAGIWNRVVRFLAALFGRS